MCCHIWTWRDVTPRDQREVRDFPRCNNRHPCVDEFYSISNDFTELCLRTITSVEVSTWTGGCASGDRIHLYDCSTSWVNLLHCKLIQACQFKIKVLCCLNVDNLLSRALLLIT